MTFDSSGPEPQDRLPGEPPHGTPARFQMPLIGEELTRPAAEVAPFRGPVPAGEPAHVTATPVPIGGTAREQTVVAVFGNVVRDGRWTVARTLNSVTAFGDTTLDLREATFEQPEIHLNVYVAFADVKVIVPPGVAVESVGTLIFGERKTQLRTTPAPGAPRVVVTTYGAFADVKVRELGPGERWGKWRDKLLGR